MDWLVVGFGSGVSPALNGMSGGGTVISPFKKRQLLGSGGAGEDVTMDSGASGGSGGVVGASPHKKPSLLEQLKSHSEHQARAVRLRSPGITRSVNTRHIDPPTPTPTSSTGVSVSSALPQPTPPPASTAAQSNDASKTPPTGTGAGAGGSGSGSGSGGITPTKKAFVKKLCTCESERVKAMHSSVVI